MSEDDHGGRVVQNWGRYSIFQYVSGLECHQVLLPSPCLRPEQIPGPLRTWYSTSMPQESLSISDWGTYI